REEYLQRQKREFERSREGTREGVSSRVDRPRDSGQWERHGPPIRDGPRCYNCNGIGHVAANCHPIRRDQPWFREEDHGGRRGARSPWQPMNSGVTGEGAEYQRGPPPPQTEVPQVLNTPRGPQEAQERREWSAPRMSN